MGFCVCFVTSPLSFLPSASQPMSPSPPSLEVDPPLVAEELWPVGGLWGGSDVSDVSIDSTCLDPVG